MCGIFGVFNRRKAAELTVVGLHSNQHRARDYAGIVSSDGSGFYCERGIGLARKVFTKEILDDLHGKDALGHTRYPTVTDSKILSNIQPIRGKYRGEPIAIAHNGNLTNIDELKELIPQNSLATSMDSEYILRLIEAQTTGDIVEDFEKVFRALKGSFALAILMPNMMIAIQDRQANRPLSVGKFEDGGYCVSSETCAFPNVGAQHLFDVGPAKMVAFEHNKITFCTFTTAEEKKCRFEGIYFSHPSSKTFGEQITKFRIELGQALEKYAPVPGGADIVTPIPDSSNFIAMGYGESGNSGKYFPVIIRNHYVGRTFIAATQAERDEEVSQKFNFTKEEIIGKRIVVIDDSIVRGTTLPKIVGMLKKLGAKAVHVRIGSPPIRYPCTYGINTPTKKELIAHHLTPEEICKQVGADSLEFLSLEALKSISPDPETFCYACMTGEYW